MAGPISYLVSTQYPAASNDATTVQPFLVPPFLDLAAIVSGNQAAYAITVPAVGKPGLTPSSCAITATAGPALPGISANMDFSLQWNSPPDATITISTANLLAALANDPSTTQGQAARQQLQTSFLLFWEALDAIAATCLLPGAVVYIMRCLAESLPLPFDQILFFHYGLNLTQGYVDLQSGMQLSFELATYQWAYSSTGGDSPLNGFADTGTGTYLIARGADQRITFDSFLGLLPTMVKRDNAAQAGGIMDLEGVVSSRYYYRLLFPATFAPNSNSAAGMYNSCTLAGADSMYDLRQATVKYYQNSKATASPGNRPIFYTYFRGRDVMVPRVHVSFNGESRLISIGQALSGVLDLVDAFMPADLAVALTTPPVTRKFRGHDVSILFDTSGSLYGGSQGLSIFDLPLVRGDSIPWVTR